MFIEVENAIVFENDNRSVENENFFSGLACPPNIFGRRAGRLVLVFL
jgi:hypothetical protein